MKLRKRTVDKVIEESYWEGFQAGLGDATAGGLEYASQSGLAAYNDIRTIAERAGYEEAQSLLLRAYARRQTGVRRHLQLPYEYRVPGSVYAECYGEARLAVKQ